MFASVQDPKKNGEWELHFRDLPSSLTSLLVLLTTANNPDGTQSIKWWKSHAYVPLLNCTCNCHETDLLCSSSQWWSPPIPSTEAMSFSLSPSVSLVSRYFSQAVHVCILSDKDYECTKVSCLVFSFLTGTYCLMNLLTAIIYNQFRGYLLVSLSHCMKCCCQYLSLELWLSCVGLKTSNHW